MRLFLSLALSFFSLSVISQTETDCIFSSVDSYLTIEEIEAEFERKPLDYEVKKQEPIFNFPEKMASFPEGEQAMMDFIYSNLQWPPLALSSCVQGRVIVQFVVEKDGFLSDIKVLRKLGEGCGEEAVRLLQIMPCWNPGEFMGEKIRQRYTIPILFKIY